MAFISLTRLRIRSFRFLPHFALHATRSFRQAKKAPGFQCGAVLVDRQWTFWTMTAWDSEASMRRFMSSDSHKEAMPHLLDWCDEAAVAHWIQPETTLPSWTEADTRMRQQGRASKVRNPSAQHESLTYRTPRTTFGQKI